MFAEGTHQLVLKEFIEKTDKPILELGAGDYSTRQIHEWTDNKILTVEHNENWLDKYQDLKCDRHDLQLLGPLEEWNDTEWGVVFVDLINWKLRKQAILLYRNADYVVIHDSEYMFREVFTRDEFSGIYKYWKEFIELFPHTTVASNKYEI
jgi:hypothetical protein